MPFKKINYCDMVFSGENLLFLFKMYFHQKSNVLLLFNENKANGIIVIKC